MPCISRKFSNSSDARLAPLSVTTFSRSPCTANVFRRHPVMAAEVVERRISTSGQRVHTSSHTSKLYPKGKGPQRSMCTSCHGLSGIMVGLSGSAVDFPATDWQGRQAFTIVSTCWAMPGHHTFSQTICLVCTIPWWPSCALDRVACQSILGITIRDPRRTSPLLMHSLSLTRL